MTIPGIYAVPQMQTSIRDFELATGERIPPHGVEEQLKRLEVDRAKELAIEEKDTFKAEEAKRLLGEEIFPWDSWDDFREFEKEIRDEFDYEAHTEKFYDSSNRGVGCRLPLLVQTLFFEQEAGAKVDFQWPSAIGVGWIEKDVRVIYRRMTSGSMAGSRRWYPFPAYETLRTRMEELSKDQSSKGKRFRRLYRDKVEIYGMKVGIEDSEKAPLVNKDDEKGELTIFKTTTTKKGRVLKSRAPAIVLKDGEMWDPLLPINDVLDSLSDIVPGMGEIFMYRITDLRTRRIRV